MTVDEAIVYLKNLQDKGLGNLNLTYREYPWNDTEDITFYIEDNEIVVAN